MSDNSGLQGLLIPPVGQSSTGGTPPPLVPGVTVAQAPPTPPTTQPSDGLGGLTTMYPGTSPAEQQLRRLAQNESLLAAEAYGVADDAFVVGFENFQAWSQEQIFSAVTPMHSSSMNSVAGAWKQIGSTLDEAYTTFFTKIQSTIGAEWEGDAAKSAAEAVTQFANSGHSFTQGMRATALKIESAAVTTDAVKVRVPVPATVVPDPLMIVNPQAAQAMAEEERQRAILAMQTTYVPGFTQAGTGVPLLAPPHNAVNGFAMPGAGMAGGSGSGPVGINGVYQGDSSGGGAPVDPAGAGSTATGAGAGGPADAYRAPGSGGGGDAAGGLQDGFGGMPAGTQSAGVASADSLGTNRSGSGTSLGSHAGGAGSVGSGPGMGGLGVVVPGVGGGFGGSGGGYDGSSGGSFGGAVPGPGSGVNGPGGRAVSGGAVADEQAATAAARAARSTSRSMGAMPHGARQNGEDDEEYRPASYLVSAGNGSELIGELPMVVPAVIGAFVEDDR